MADRSLNKVMLIGRLGRDPEVKYLPSGRAVANFSIATSERWTDKEGKQEERTEWHKIVVFGKLAEICGEYLNKGKQVYIEGRLQTRKWQDQSGQDKYTTEIVVNEMIMLGGKGSSGPADEIVYDEPPSRSPQEGLRGGQRGGGSSGGSEDDIPF